MKKTFYNCSKAERQEKISNRMLISFGGAMIGLLLCYFMYRIARGELGAAAIVNYNLIMLIAFILFAVLSIGCYVISLFDRIKPDAKFARLQVRERARNYGHAFLVAAIISFYVNFAFYTRWLPMESAPVVIGFLKNIVKSFHVVFWALGIYAVGTVVYHMYLYYRKKW